MIKLKRMLALLLVMAVVFGLAAFPAYADGDAAEAPAPEAPTEAPAPEEGNEIEPAPEEEPHIFNYIFEFPDTDDAPASGGSEDMLSFAASPYGDGAEEPMESSYSSVTEGFITTAKNQGSYGTCWSFAASSVAEASLIRSGEQTKSVDLSELQLVYYLYGRDKYDPLGNASGDSSAVSDDYWLHGGNYYWTMWAMAGWSNGAAESVMPYSQIKQSFPDSNNYDYDIVHLQNARIIPYEGKAETVNGIITSSTVGNNYAIKQAIKEYGAVGMSYLHAYNWYTNSQDAKDETNGTECYSKTYRSHYNPSEYVDGGGHAVTIVGWNDDYPKEYFSTEAPGNGAWLVKNNWGSYWGTDGDADYTDTATAGAQGYFWVSYYDYGLLVRSKEVYVFDFDNVGKYDNNYQYDGACGSDEASVNDTEYFNHFSIGATYKLSAADKETVKAVGFGLYSADVDYSIQLYKVSSLSADPEKTGTPLLATPVTGHADYEGYYTVDIPEADNLTLEEGDIVSVVISLYRKNLSLFVPVDTSYRVSKTLSFVADSSKDYTFIYADNGFESLRGTGNTLRVKLFTTSINLTPTVSLDKTEATLFTNVDGEKTLSLTPTFTNDSGCTVAWQSSNSSVASVDQNGLVTAKGVGTANITCTATKNNKYSASATCAVTVKAVTEKLAFADRSLVLADSAYVSTSVSVSDKSTCDLYIDGAEQLKNPGTGYDSAWSVGGLTVRLKDTSVRFEVADSAECLGKTVNVTVKDRFTGKADTCAVTVTAGVKTISVSPARLGLAAGGSAVVNVVISPAEALYDLSASSSSSLVSVAKGTPVVDKAADTVTVPFTVKAGSSSSASSSASVKFTDNTSGRSVSTSVLVGGSNKMVMSPASLSLTVGSSSTVKATVSGSTRSLTKWSTSDSSVATVSDGKITAKGEGVCIITAKYLISYTCSCVVTVSPAGPPSTDIALPATASVQVGSTVTLTANTADAYKPVTWASDNEAVATVSTSGVVTGKAAGTAKIKATNSAGKAAECTVTVTAAPAAVTLTGVSFTDSSVKAKLLIVKSIKNMVKPVFSDGKSHSGEYSVSYKSNNTKIATVSSSGTVMGRKKGSTTITVTVTYNGVSKSADLPVNVVSAFS